MALRASFDALVLALAFWVSKPAYGQDPTDYRYRDARQVLAYRQFNQTVTSISYPGMNDNNLDRKWLIQTEVLSDDIVKVTFNDFRLGNRSAGLCSDDQLKFYDGRISSFNLFGPYCGTIHPEVIYSTGRYLYVQHLQVLSHQDRYKGFSLNVVAVAKEEAAGLCRKRDGHDNVVRLNGSSGAFFSPGYPSPLTPNTTCTWVISVPAGKRVKLIFDDFNINNCSDQYVDIFDGKESESRKLGQFCNWDRLDGILEVYSSGSYMRFSFFVSPLMLSNTKRGFKARYEASEMPSAAYTKEFCYRGNVNNGNLSLSGTSGTLQSPKEGFSYPPDWSCDWLITAPDGKIVKLSFHELLLPYSNKSTCFGDYVEVRDGKESSSPSKGRFCGSDIPEDIRSSGRYMKVSFRSDTRRSQDEYGFKATYTVEDSKKAGHDILIISLVVGMVFFAAVSSFVKYRFNQIERYRLAAASISMETRTNTSVSPALPLPRTSLATTTTTSVSPTTPPPPLDPYPSESPPSYPGEEAVPQYPSAESPTTPRIPMATTATTSVSPTTSTPPPYPYPTESPPSYPGEEAVPQYPPPGESYPWYQSALVEPSASHLSRPLRTPMATTTTSSLSSSALSSRIPLETTTTTSMTLATPSPPPCPNLSESPSSYHGEEAVPQYLLPGESYPWHHDESAQVEPSAPLYGSVEREVFV